MSGSSNGTSFDWTRTEYDAAGRTRRVSNPRTLSSTIEIPGSSQFTLWTTTDYDGLDRAVKTTYQDGQYSTRSHSGRDVTLTDPASKQRKILHDGLGRVVSAIEPDAGGGLNVTTTYQYDPMGNLTGVTQGSQTRSFVYDSLSQLKQEIQPESGTTLYTYSSDSLPTSRKDARGTFTYYELYDALHRVGRIRWSDGTPTATFGYDAYSTSTPVNFGRGRRTSTTDGEGGATFRYDSMGRLSTLVRTTAGATLTGNYGYNLAGGLQSAAYPGIADGPAGALTIHFGHDNAGRQISAWWDNGSLYQQMVSSYGFSHGTTGATETTGFGNGLTETVSYNNRLQPVSRVVPGALDLGYTFNRPGDGKNNGDIQRIDDNITPSWDQSFTYDGLGRTLNSTGPNNIQLTFSYDRWGNKSQTLTARGPSKPLSSWLWRTGSDGNRVRKVSGGQTRLHFHDPLGLVARA